MCVRVRVQESVHVYLRERESVYCVEYPCLCHRSRGCVLAGLRIACIRAHAQVDIYITAHEFGARPAPEVVP